MTAMSNFNINTAMVAGEVTDPPRFRETQGGSVCEVRIRTTETSIRQGQEKTFATWHSVTIWGDRAVQISNELKPGMGLAASGRIKNSTYTNNNGEKVHKSEIVAKDVTILDTAPANNNGNNNGGGYQSNNSGGYQNNTGNNNGGGGFNSGPIPF
jgi:single-strand DNA-binding protein